MYIFLSLLCKLLKEVILPNQFSNCCRHTKKTSAAKQQRHKKHFVQTLSEESGFCAQIFQEIRHITNVMMCQEFPSVAFKLSQNSRVIQGISSRKLESSNSKWEERQFVHKAAIQSAKQLLRNLSGVMMREHS